MNKTYLVIFETYINGQLARTEVPTVVNPLVSRTVRGDCEAIARASFTELANKIGHKFDGKIKAVECVEFKPIDEGDSANYQN